MTWRTGGSLRSALEELRDILEDLARAAEVRSRSRCPHRDARNRCRFAGPCRNQRRTLSGPLVCADDARLRFDRSAT